MMSSWSRDHSMLRVLIVVLNVNKKIIFSFNDCFLLGMNDDCQKENVCNFHAGIDDGKGLLERISSAFPDSCLNVILS